MCHQLLSELEPNQRRGSKPRCHWLTHADRAEVAARLTKLIAPHGTVTASDKWLPDGFKKREEAQLHQTALLLPKGDRDHMRTWWFRHYVGGSKQMGPSFDLAGTCTIAGRKGIFLVEAKAHEAELKEAEGKKLRAQPSPGEKENHAHIGRAIEWANWRLGQETKLPWSLSCDHHYQMSNRFATACKLCDLGYPVVLVYLGFLNATEMADQSPSFADADHWETVVKEHSQPLFPPAVWGQRWNVHGTWLIPLISCLDIRYDQPIA